MSFVKNIEYFWSFQVVQPGSKVQTKTRKLEPLMSTLKFIGRSFCFACEKDINRHKSLSFSEKKALWAGVLAIFIIYFTLAAKFYVDTQ